ncbi:threalose-6-phosphate phosphatase [Scheffersomyces spartinae]|uniref:Threalose-6-phosphate phosphatase n=1 Tax=Scheffersomyces spartinae TaxID=45513 RepID=A0A9P8AGB8_9ASCO|nr:threalose-6-phosphate phosphatase [Scheffersomyces spartinae]KAG7191529.1 threalose-6-phosphate phosphatase [Scheffersomyces spartinae]
MPTLPARICRVNGDDANNNELMYSWEVEPVHGNLAVFSSNNYLVQHTEWETHLIGWTGELVNKTNKASHIGTIEDIKDDPLYLDDNDKLEIESKITLSLKSDHVHPVWLLRRDQLKWRRYAEDVLWPVFHYIQGQPSDGKAESHAWHDYVKFNEAFYNKIKAIYKPGDVIWIHDYYLLLLPQLLRMQFPDAYIGLSLHAPFPSSEYFRGISKRSQLLDGMLGADKITFQSESFLGHFLSCCARILGCEVEKDKVLAYGTEISLSTLPIGIDSKRIEHDAFSANHNVEDKVKALRDVYYDKKLIVGRDKLDSVRGVEQKLQAFEMFLYMYPEWRDKVVLIQVSTPGYTHSAKLEKRVTELVNQVNSKYGTLNWTPVLHYQMRIEKAEYLALLRVADLSLNTSVRDGMNTTCLEYVVCQKENHSPLILSEFTGTASVLDEAILVNPWDSVGIAKTINECLTMSDNQRAVLESKLYKKVVSNTIQSWTYSFLDLVLKQVATTRGQSYSPALNRPMLYENYKLAKRRLFLFDYDGTLTPIVRDPAAAIPSQRLNDILDTLTRDPKNRIWVISGRDQAFLEKWMGSKNIGMSAEHGCFMKDFGSKEWVNLAASFDMSWQLKVDEIFQKYTDRTPGSFIERKKVALTWHYRKSDHQLGAFQADLCHKELESTVARDYELEVMAGKANIEVRPKFVNKGEIAKRLALHPHGEKQDPNAIPQEKVDEFAIENLPDFMLCLGDDLTDEDMFRSLNKIQKDWLEHGIPKNEYGNYGIYPVAVGPSSKKTNATAHLNEPSQVLETLGLLAGQVSLFESAGSVDLDDRGHLANSETSERSKKAIEAFSMKKEASIKSSSSHGTNA